MGPLGHSGAALAALCGSVPGAAVLAVRPALRVGLGERLGATFEKDAVAPGAVWVHAASVGEVLAAFRLLDHLHGAGHPLCATAQTLAGREVLRGSRPEIPSALAPLDHPWCAAAALGRVQPAALVLVENELWPFWIRAAHERGIPVLSVSARLSERSLGRWLRVGWFSRGTARRLAAVGARTESDAERFCRLGVPESRVRITGDLKLEPLKAAQPGEDLLVTLGAAPMVIAASTHEGEELLALAAFAAAERGGAQAILTLAPRHAARFDAVAGIVRATGRRLHRRSALGAEPLVAGDVLLLDSVGELAGLFGYATLAFVGGSFVDRGGHNVIEPVQAGCPAVVGPHVRNVEHLLALLEPTGAVQRVADTAALGEALLGALSDPQGARRRGEAGHATLEPARGASRRSAELVEAVLVRRGGGE